MNVGVGGGVNVNGGNSSFTKQGGGASLVVKGGLYGGLSGSVGGTLLSSSGLGQSTVYAGGNGGGYGAGSGARFACSGGGGGGGGIGGVGSSWALICEGGNGAGPASLGGGAAAPNGCAQSTVPGGGGGGWVACGYSSSASAGAPGRVVLTYTSGPTTPNIFAPGVPYLAGSSQTGAVATDVNNDGRLDFIVVNRYSNSVSVFINNGSGVFAPKADISTTANPYAIAHGDFNNDGKIDFVITHVSNITTSESINIYLNNGNGTFTHGQDYDTGVINAFSVKTGDLNADGKPDLAIVGGVGGTGYVSTFLGAGNGTFGSRTLLPHTGGYPYDVSIKDFNGDGKLDMAAPASAGQLAVYINNGTGTFASNVLYPGVAGAPTIESVDLNADSKLDLVVSVFGNSSVYTNNGSGVFTKTTSNVNLKPGFKLADVNADGKVDAISLDATSKVSVYLGTGSGNFTLENRYTASALPNVVATGDLNGDSRTDFVITDNSNSRNAYVFLNSFTPVIVPTDPRGGWDGWISLKGTSTSAPFSPYSVSTLPSPWCLNDSCTTTSWAWGSTVLGWIDFSGTVAPAVIAPTVNLQVQDPNSLQWKKAITVPSGSSVNLKWGPGN